MHLLLDTVPDLSMSLFLVASMCIFLISHKGAGHDDTQVMWFRSRHAVFGGSDAKHVLKAIPRGIRTASRSLSILGYYCHLSPLAAGGCPVQCLMGHDTHSDREAANFLNPRHLMTVKSDDIGIHLLQLPDLKLSQF